MPRELLLSALAAFLVIPAVAQSHPDLNGIWQALNEANYDIEGHTGRAALALQPGPYGPVPAAPGLALGAVTCPFKAIGPLLPKAATDR